MQTIRIVCKLFFAFYSLQTIRGFFGKNLTVCKLYGFSTPSLQTIRITHPVCKLGGFCFINKISLHPVCILSGYMNGYPHNIQTGQISILNSRIIMITYRTASILDENPTVRYRNSASKLSSTVRENHKPRI